MTTSSHIQNSVGLPARLAIGRRLKDAAVAALMLALVVALAYGAAWLLPLELAVPRPG